MTARCRAVYFSQGDLLYASHTVFSKNKQEVVPFYEHVMCCRYERQVNAVGEGHCCDFIVYDLDAKTLLLGISRFSCTLVYDFN